MTDIDRLSRDLDDLRSQIREQGYRIRELEKKGLGKLTEPLVQAGGIPVGGPVDPREVYVSPESPAIEGAPIIQHYSLGGNVTRIRPSVGDGQFCQCGREACRAPDCPSHADPMGR